ncbi:hypothetical protein CEXT_232591 [Caerostris extrusa]|uniref:Uncharacterized protein n=1 Tax=Caerostris extrusa TaxID=172846 RepID=A0AAV4X4T1_CAEEX|nr:hypothetical protein CEXT_232591 [Caerostris extrusa]
MLPWMSSFYTVISKVTMLINGTSGICDTINSVLIFLESPHPKCTPLLLGVGTTLEISALGYHEGGGG